MAIRRGGLPDQKHPDQKHRDRSEQRGLVAATKSRFFATLRYAPAAAGHVILSEAKDLFFFAPRNEVGA